MQPALLLAFFFAQSQPQIAEVAAPPKVIAAPAAAIDLPPGTPLVVEADRTVPLHLGQPIQGHLVYPVFAGNTLVFPAGSLVHGTVVDLRPDAPRRLDSRLRGDFTPFTTPALQFDTVQPPGAAPTTIQTSITSDGSTVVRIVPPPPSRGGIIRSGYNQLKEMAQSRIAVVTAPGKRDRLVKLLYSQLPYHPQRIEKGTSWTAETSSLVAVSVPETPVHGLPVPSPEDPLHPHARNTSAPRSADIHIWNINAYLREPLSSRDAHVGEAIHAEVAQPVLNPDNTVAVPQGAILEGEITQVKPARRFGRAGVLQFDLRRLRLPGSEEASVVQTTVSGIDAAGGQNLQIDAEGKVKPKPQDKLAVPLLLLALASRPLDRDGGRHGLAKSAVASNSLGAIGFIVGTAGGWPSVAAGIGYYGAAVSVYNRWIKRGAETTFRRDTRLELQTTARPTAVLGRTAAAAPSPDRR